MGWGGCQVSRNTYTGACMSTNANTTTAPAANAGIANYMERLAKVAAMKPEGIARPVSWEDASRYDRYHGTPRRCYDIGADRLASLAEVIEAGEGSGIPITDWLPKTTIQKISAFNWHRRLPETGAAVTEIVSIIAAISLGFGGFVSYCRSLADAAGETRAAAIEAFSQSLK